MKDFTEQLEAVLVEQLQFIEQEYSNRIKRSEEAIKRIAETLEQLKKFILTYRFKSKTEEIEFFKCIKPRFLSKLIYHHIIFQVETKRPPGNKKLVCKFLEHELKILRKYFDKDIEFYTYYRTDSTHLDSKYFLRNQYDIRLQIECNYFDADHRFSTTHDYKVARIMAHISALKYLENELNQLNEHPTGTAPANGTRVALEWTESKSALVELIYALHSLGAIESSKAGIKEIAACFEALFRIELGDYYRVFTDIKRRKTGRAKFLEALKDNLLKKMDDADNRY